MNTSLGASKRLLGFVQFPIRVLEQCMMDLYKPDLNPNANQIIFYNFAYSRDDFKMSSTTGDKQYLVYDETMTNVLASANSYNQLRKSIGLSNVSVRNNMD